MGRELPQGTTVGVCTIERLRERTGLCEVYAAVGPSGQPCRVSFFHVDPEGQPWHRFVAESQQLASLQHPCIAEIIETAVTSDGRPYQALSLGKGEELSARLRRSGALTTAEALACAQQIGAALHSLHALDLIHRGLNPERVFVCENSDEAKPRVRLLDAGVTRLLDDSAAGALVSNPEYKAPEQLTGFSIDVGPASDQYALALLLYQSLTSSRPFKADSAAATILQVVRGGAESLRTLRPDIPRGVDTAVMRALAKERTGRYASVAEFLTAVQGTEPIDQAVDALVGSWLRSADSAQAAIRQAQSQADSKPSFQVVALQLGGGGAVPSMIEDQATVPNTMEEVMRLAVPIERIAYGDPSSPSRPVAIADSAPAAKVASVENADSTDRNPLITGAMSTTPAAPGLPISGKVVVSGKIAATAPQKVSVTPDSSQSETTGPLTVPAASMPAALVAQPAGAALVRSPAPKTSSIAERVGLVIVGVVLGIILRHLLG